MRSGLKSSGSVSESGLKPGLCGSPEIRNGSLTAPRNPPYWPGIRFDGPGILNHVGSDTLRGTLVEALR